MKRAALLAALALAAGCAGTPPHPAAFPVPRLIGMQQLAPDLEFEGVRVGGLSGLDYDAHSGDWLLASDDRGEHGPARFYRARFDIGAHGVGTPVLLAMQAWRQPDGSAYPARGRAGVVADVESLRIDPRDGSLWYGSEGDRKDGIPSFVRRADGQGRFLAELPFPAALQIRPDCACGGRSNLGPEGLAFTPDGALLWMALEGPVIQDGPVAAPGRSAFARLSLMERRGGMVAQYAYPLDPAPVPAFAGGAVDNGIAEILALGTRRLLVLERAGRQLAPARFDFAFDVRLYEVALERAAPVDPDAPLDPATLRPAAKRLLFDMSALPPGWADNYEGMAWGPPLPNGHRSLVLVSDNNFGSAPTRFLVFDAGLE